MTQGLGNQDFPSTHEIAIAYELNGSNQFIVILAK